MMYVVVRGQIGMALIPTTRETVAMMKWECTKLHNETLPTVTQCSARLEIGDLNVFRAVNTYITMHGAA
jgi:hypothetical protein